MARLPLGLNLFRTTMASARLSMRTDVAHTERLELTEERWLLEKRLEQLRDAIQMLEAAPQNRTATALLEKYRRNERQLGAEVRAVEERERRAEVAGLGDGVMAPG